MAATVNMRTMLMCESLGLPDPTVTWEKDGVAIPNNGLRYRLVLASLFQRGSFQERIEKNENKNAALESATEVSTFSYILCYISGCIIRGRWSSHRCVWMIPGSTLALPRMKLEKPPNP